MRRDCLRIFRRIKNNFTMNNKRDRKNFSIFSSPFEEEREAWEEIYGLEDYDNCSDYEGNDYIRNETRKNRIYDLDNYDFPLSFVSFDFENLFPQRVTACSVGMVKYKNGKIVDHYYTLIRPPFEYEGEKGPALTWIHGFTEEKLKNEKTFVEILPKMEEFIEGLPLVAHNACVERACIHDCCAYYNIETSIPYEEIMDTYLLSKAIEKKLGMDIRGAGSYSLNVVCQRFGVPVLRHHHACDDAEMCGNLFLVLPQYLSGELELDASSRERTSDYWAKDSSLGNNIYESYAARGHKVLCGDVLQKDLSCADPNNPFYDRKVVITGVFNIERQELANQLKTMGADIDTGVGSKTNYLLIGDEPGPSKLRKFDELIAAGKDVRKIYQQDLDLILAGKDYEKYHTELPVPKPKADVPKERKTTWPNLVKKFKQYVEGEEVEFTERELQSEDYRLLSLYYKQQQKVATTKDTVLVNLRELDEACECEFKKDILACFDEGEDLTKELAYERMQKVFTKYGLNFKAKTCVLSEFGVEFKEYKTDKVLHLTILHLPNL
jgi:DNA polymerase-3 subunit epsilon